jgi:endonuclease/exonuclease/phosphatase family metal-dependent hydrolase
MHLHVLRTGPRPRAVVAVAAVALAGALTSGLLADRAEAAKETKSVKAKVMIRNLYLGANLRPALDAENCNQFVDIAGEIVNQMRRTDFATRAQALAQEILSKNPDLVGLQEVALWRTGPVNFGAVTAPSATQVEADFLQLLLDELNRGKERYEVVVVKDELDFESPVNDDGQGSGCTAVDHNERFTQRDAILAKVGKKVKTSNPTSGTFNLLLRATVAGAVSVNSTRGWTAVDAKVKGSKKFHFVNTHIEAYDDQASGQTGSDGNTYGKGAIREVQARELFAPGGPTTGSRVILVGDFNSDDDTVANDGDRNAYLAILAAGFRQLDLETPPLSCCLSDPNLVGGSIADFDHQIDHILTNTRKIKLVNSSMTGHAPVGGLWPSDHAGVFTTLRVPAET